MSKENRLAAKKRSKQAKMRRIRNRIIKVCVVLALIGLAVFIGFQIFYSSMEKNAKANRYLNADGTIDADKALSYVDVADYKSIVVKREEQLPTKSEVQSKIDAFVNSNKETFDKAGTEIDAEDSVSLTYKVVVEEKEVESLKAEKKSYTLGSKSISEDFDKAIADKKVGDNFSIDVKYDSDNTNESLAGKTATYVGKIESVTKKPELTDELVEKAMGKELDKNFAHTVDGLWQYYGDSIYKDNVDSFIRKTVIEGTKVNKYPYLYTLNEQYMQVANYESTASYYAANGLAISKYALAGVKDKDDSAFNKAMNKAAKSSVKTDLAWQAIYEDAKLAKIDETSIKNMLKKDEEYKEENYAEIVKSNTIEVLAQAALQDTVFEYVKSLAKYEGDEKLFWVDDPKEEESEEKTEE